MDQFSTLVLPHRKWIDLLTINVKQSAPTERREATFTLGFGLNIDYVKFL